MPHDFMGKQVRCARCGEAFMLSLHPVAEGEPGAELALARPVTTPQRPRFDAQRSALEEAVAQGVARRRAQVQAEIEAVSFDEADDTPAQAGELDDRVAAFETALELAGMSPAPVQPPTDPVAPALHDAPTARDAAPSDDREAVDSPANPLPPAASPSASSTPAIVPAPAAPAAPAPPPAPVAPAMPLVEGLSTLDVSQWAAGWEPTLVAGPSPAPLPVTFTSLGVTVHPLDAVEPSDIPRASSSSSPPVATSTAPAPADTKRDAPAAPAEDRPAPAAADASTVPPAAQPTQPGTPPTASPPSKPRHTRPAAAHGDLPSLTIPHPLLRKVLRAPGGAKPSGEQGIRSTEPAAANASKRNPGVVAQPQVDEAAQAGTSVLTEFQSQAANAPRPKAAAKPVLPQAASKTTRKSTKPKDETEDFSFWASAVGEASDRWGDYDAFNQSQEKQTRNQAKNQG